MRKIVHKRRCKENPTLEKILLEKNFLSTHKEIAKLPTLRATQMQRYLSKNGFKNESKNFIRENVDGKSFICLMCCKEGVKLLSKDLHISSEKIEKLKDLYKNIHLFRKKFCITYEGADEEPFY